MEGGRLLSVSGDGEVEDGMILLASDFSFVFAGFLSVVRRVQGHAPGLGFDMIPRYGLAGMNPKS